MPSGFKHPLVLMLGLTVILMTSCSGNATVHLLEGDWFYSTEGDKGTYSAFDVSTMNSLPKYLENREGILYLKTYFSLPESLQGGMLALYLGRIEIADRVYLNGRLIGETGMFPEQWFNDWNKDRRYDIPPALVSWNGENELLLEIYVNRTGLISGDIQIGAKNQVDVVYSLNSLLHRQINMLFSFVLLIFGFNSLLVYSRRRTDEEILWFALVSIVFAFSQAGIFLTSIPGFHYSQISYIPFMKFIGILEILTIYCFLRFTRSFFKIKSGRSAGLFSFLPSFLLMILYLLQVDFAAFNGFYNTYEMSLALPALYIVFLAVRAFVKKERGAGLFVTALVPTCLLILHDMILTNVIEGYILMVTGIALPLLLTIINVIFGRNLAEDRTRAEALNLTLEETINRHLDELKDTSDQLSHASRKYKFIHSFQLSARESEILGLIIDGQSNDQIAETLNISVRTVSAHLYKIYKKINLHSRTDIFAAFNKD